MKETKQLLLYLMLAVTVAYFYISMILFDSNNGVRSGEQLMVILSFFIMLAPCFFESVFNHSKDPIEFVLPVSAFEKYLHVMIRYLVIVPVTVLFLNQIFSLLWGIFPNSLIDEFVHTIQPLHLSKQAIWGFSQFWALFLLCAVLFRKSRFLWAAGFFIGFMAFIYLIVSVGIILLKLSFPEWDSLGFSVNSWGSLIQYSFVMPQKLTGVWIMSHLAIQITWWVGILVSCYYIIREREL